MLSMSGPSNIGRMLVILDELDRRMKDGMFAMPINEYAALEWFRERIKRRLK